MWLAWLLNGEGTILALAANSKQAEEPIQCGKVGTINEWVSGLSGLAMIWVGRCDMDAAKRAAKLCLGKTKQQFPFWRPTARLLALVQYVYNSL